jgi:hypothetical protein
VKETWKSEVEFHEQAWTNLRKLDDFDEVVFVIDPSMNCGRISF